jgi:hypothetical protein
VDVEEYNYVAAQAAESAQEANDLAQELQAVKERLALAEQRALEAACERDAANGMQQSAEERAERLYRDRNEVDEKLKVAVHERNTVVDCGLGGGDWSCGRCVACLSRVNAHLHDENKRLLTRVAELEQNAMVLEEQANPEGFSR